MNDMTSMCEAVAVTPVVEVVSTPSALEVAITELISKMLTPKMVVAAIETAFNDGDIKIDRMMDTAVEMVLDSHKFGRKLDSEIEDKLSDAMEDRDFECELDSKISGAVDEKFSEFDMDCAVEEAVDKIDFNEKVSEALDTCDITDLVADSIGKFAMKEPMAMATTVALEHSEVLDGINQIIAAYMERHFDEMLSAAIMKRFEQ